MRIKWYRKFGWIVCLCLLFNGGCVELFEFDPSDVTEELLVVDGQFVAGQEIQSLRLQKTNNLGVVRNSPVTGARVNIFTEDGFGENYWEVEPGIYELFPQFITGTPGSVLHLEIELENGKLYRTPPTKVPQKVKATSLSAVYNSTKALNDIGNVIDVANFDIFVSASFPNNGSESYLRWFVEDFYSFPEIVCSPLSAPSTCFLQLPINRQHIAIFTNENSTLQELKDYKIISKTLKTQDNREFRGRHYFNAYQYAITKDAYHYWREVDKISNQQGNIFDPVPATVPGNVSNVNDDEEVVLGYFEITAIDTVRTFLIPSDIKENKFLPMFCPEPGLPFIGQIPFECCNCLRFENATLERPPWF